MTPFVAIVSLWLAWAISWIAAAVWTDKTEKRVGVKGELAYRIPLIIGTLVFLPRAHGYFGPLRLWFVTRNEAWACTASIACGLVFSWWARIHLGTLWSGSVTKKSDHHVSDTGPYRTRLEERWLSGELDAGAYEAYRRRVPMLLPFGPR